MSQSHDSYENIDSEAESDSLNRMSPSLSLVSDLLRNWLKKTNLDSNFWFHNGRKSQ